MSLAEELAGYEVGWWKSHHERDMEGLTHNMAKLYELQFGIPYETAREAVDLRVQATQEHDLAEKFQDGEDAEKAKEHWNRTRDLLVKHFETLLQHQQKSD